MDTEITYEEAEKMVQARLTEYPECAKLVADPAYHAALKEILLLKDISETLLPLIEHEVRIVLAHYAPIDELSANLASAAELTYETAESLATLIEAIALSSVREELYAFQDQWNQEIEKSKNVPEAPKDLKEKLELRPDGTPTPEAPGETGGGVRPLTRDEVLRALSPARTMAGDIASLTKQASTSSDTPPVPPAAKP